MSRLLGSMTPAAALRRVPRSLGALAFGVLAAGVLWLSLEGRAASTRFQAGVAFAPDACDAALGRGVGRTVVHELAHQIAGDAIDSGEADTCEYFSADHRSRYYGDLRWGRAGTRLASRLD